MFIANVREQENDSDINGCAADDGTSTRWIDASYIDFAPNGAKCQLVDSAQTDRGVFLLTYWACDFADFLLLAFLDLLLCEFVFEFGFAFAFVLVFVLVKGFASCSSTNPPASVSTHIAPNWGCGPHDTPATL
ncbi:MAG TPA: hypothetical protein VLQ90_01715 [Pyrinomonadaceae bacterium]|nr:hypothetical protein [Pyrinomonadaceae bacterium]